MAFQKTECFFIDTFDYGGLYILGIFWMLWVLEKENQLLEKEKQKAKRKSAL